MNLNVCENVIYKVYKETIFHLKNDLGQLESHNDGVSGPFEMVRTCRF